MKQPKDTPIRLPKVIYRPDLQHRFKKWFYVGVSTLAWLFWLYLFAPLLDLTLGIFGWFHFDQYQLTNAAHTFHAIEIYAVVIAVSGAAFLLWAFYNLTRFRRHNRRQVFAAVTAAETARHYQLGERQIHALHAAQVVRVHHDESGVITHIDHVQLAGESSAA